MTPDTEQGQPEQDELADTAIINEIGKRLIKKYLHVFKELTK